MKKYLVLVLVLLFSFAQGSNLLLNTVSAGIVGLHPNTMEAEPCGVELEDWVVACVSYDYDDMYRLLAYLNDYVRYHGPIDWERLDITLGSPTFALRIPTEWERFRDRETQEIVYIRWFSQDRGSYLLEGRFIVNPRPNSTSTNFTIQVRIR